MLLFYGITEWFGLEETLKPILFQPLSGSNYCPAPSASLRDWKSLESTERKMLPDLKGTPPSKIGTATLIN